MDLFPPPNETLKTRLNNPWHELAVLSLMMMETSWVAMWYSALSAIGRWVPYEEAFVVLGVIMIGTHMLARSFNLQTIQKWVRWAIVSGLILASLYIALVLLLYWPRWPGVGMILGQVWVSSLQGERIPPEFWVMLAILLIWRRGVGLARRPVSIDHILLSFQTGALSFFIYGILIPFLSYQTVVIALALFLSSGLVAMSCGRIFDTGRSRGGKIKQMSRGWVLGILLTACLIVGLGLGLSGLLQGRLGEWIGQGVLLVVTILVGVIFLILYPVVLLLAAIIPWLEQMFSRLAIFSILSQIGDTISQLLQSSNYHNLENIFNKIAFTKPLILGGLLIIVVLGILGALNLRYWFRKIDLEKNDEDLLAGQALLALWRAALRKRFRDGRARLARRFRLDQAENLLTAARIRWIYRRMMKLSATLGNPRPPAVTPLEFLPSLHRLLPQTGFAPDQITQAYQRVRYGEQPERSEEAEQVVAAWALVQAEAKKIKKVVKKKPETNPDWRQPPGPGSPLRRESDYTKHV